MAAKRRAGNDLNHDNWDNEEEPEEAGTFKKASADALKNRVIRTAKRRNPISSGEGGENKSAFADFSAFSKPAATPTAAVFGFLSNITKPAVDPLKTNGIAENNTTNSSVSISNNTSTSKGVNDTSSDYYAKLKGLNESVTSWIRKKVDENPLINLQPIFKDYEKYLKDLELENKSNISTTTPDTKKPEPALPGFSFKPTESFPASVTSKDVAQNSKKASFEFTAAPPTSTPFKFGTPSSSFSFGSTTNDPTAATKFSFGSTSSTSSSGGFSNLKSITSTTQPFSFSNKSSEGSSEQNNDEDEDDTPPKVEFTPVVEKDHLYTIRCKVFVKKEGSYSDRGVGNLYLKPIPNNEKVQLIVRADTNLGNLLLNFILSKNIPIKRMGKKDVMLVCLPTPEVEPPPVPILLRVKTPEDADSLLDILEKHQK